MRHVIASFFLALAFYGMRDNAVVLKHNGDSGHEAARTLSAKEKVTICRVN